MGRRYRWLDLLLATFAVTIAVGLMAGAIAFEHNLDPFDDQSFSPAAWAAANSENRGMMARDAIRHLPAGTPKDRVRQLLGEPRQVPGLPASSVDAYGHRLEHFETWAYYLGSWSGLGPYALDSAFLNVHFDSDGRVVKAEITGG